MSDSKQNVSANDDLKARLRASRNFSKEHDEEWRNEVARDLNLLVIRALFLIENYPDGNYTNYAEAAIRIVERVAEFEEIETVKRKTE